MFSDPPVLAQCYPSRRYRTFVPIGEDAGEPAERCYPMIFVKPGSWRSHLCAVLAVVLVMLSTPVSAQEQLTDVKPLAGKWHGFARNIPADLMVNDDGSYEAVVHMPASRGGAGARQNLTVSGTMTFADGKVLFKHSDGSTGTVRLYNDGKG